MGSKNERTFSTDVKHKDDVNFETEKGERRCGLLTSGNSILSEASKSASGSTNNWSSWVCCYPGSRSVAWRWGPESATALPPLPGACAKLKAALKEKE